MNLRLFYALQNTEGSIIMSLLDEKEHVATLCLALQFKVVEYFAGGVLISSYLILIHQLDNFGGLRWAEAAWYEWVHWLPGPPIAARLYLTNSAKRKRRKPPQLMERWGASVILPPAMQLYMHDCSNLLLLLQNCSSIGYYNKEHDELLNYYEKYVIISDHNVVCFIDRKYKE